MLKKILKGVGMVLTMLALLFIIRKLMGMDVDLSILFGRYWPVFAVCILIYAVLVYFLGKPWKKFVTVITDEQIDGREAYYVCTKSNLLKYIPGNVFQFIGRNELAVIHDLKHKDVACATVLDTLCMVLSAMVIAVIFHARGVILWFQQYMTLAEFMIMITLLCVTGVAFLLFLYKKVTYFHFLFSRRNRIAVLEGTAFFGIFYIASASMFIVILHFVTGLELTLPRIGLLIGTWAIGYLMGYVMPGSPGGVGVRELVLCFMLQGILQTDEVLLATVLLRVTNIVGEIIAFIVAALLYKNMSKHSESAKPVKSDME